MVIQGTFLTPTGLFLVSMAIMYLVTAILHPEEFGMVIIDFFHIFCHVMLYVILSFYLIVFSPPGMIIYGLMYFICIPSGYLLLTIYSLVNMHIVSWGTRESSK